MTAQRIQVLLREEVTSIVKDLSSDSRLTLSKMVAVLVEEALEARGLYDPKAFKRKRSDDKFSMSDVIREAAETAGRKVEVVARKTERLEDSDIELINKLKKLKALEEAGLL